MAWPYKLAARERLLLRRQATFDKRNIRPVWFWIFDLEHSPFDEVHLQTSKHYRKYFGPIPAYFYIESQGGDPQVVDGGVDRPEEHKVTISRAEVVRLAQVLASHPDFNAFDVEGLEVYYPRAQDVYQYGDDLWEFQDRGIPSADWGTTSIETVYSTVATKMRMDSVALDSPLVIQLQQPPLDFPPELNAEKGAK